MSEIRVENVNISAINVLITPTELHQALPMTAAAEKLVVESREVIKRILNKEDHRLFIVIGPCSIHDIKAAKEYATKLKALANEVQDTLYLIMRVYFEKPRTTVGWKGLINDPHLNDTFKIEEGLHIGRQLLRDILEIGLPTATEALDPISPQYLQDLITWSAIGARTTESQTHREMASGLSSPIGFKNGTDGGFAVAINAMQSAEKPHCFLGIDSNGKVSTIQTTGNQYAHIVLRGGNNKTNYDAHSIAECEAALAKANIQPNIMIDCSHANSNKDPARQTLVMENVSEQILAGNNSIIGLMVESHLHWGNQALTSDLSKLKYGVSITDACIDWETTEKAIRQMRMQLKDVLPQRIK